MTKKGGTVREARDDDRERFLAMWEDFTAFDPDEPGDRDMGWRNWERSLNPRHSLQCLIATDENDVPLGFTLYLTFPFTWSVGDVCYLQDLYVCPQSRGKGLARAMIETLAEIGREKGWFKIFWMTQHDNSVAQALYDKVADRKSYVRYDLELQRP
jgi:ribosomal protein S18 acetylase RimI-like enzyme